MSKLPLLASICVGCILILYSTIINGIMRFRIPQIALLASTSGMTFAASCPQVDTSKISLAWHPPNKTAINDLATVINGTGVSSYIFNSSSTPAGASYSTYNWCNMPHVRAEEYVKAPAGYKLEYVEVVSIPTSWMNPRLTHIRFTAITNEHHMRQTLSHTKATTGNVTMKHCSFTACLTPMEMRLKSTGKSTPRLSIHSLPRGSTAAVSSPKYLARASRTLVSTARTSSASTTGC